MCMIIAVLLTRWMTDKEAIWEISTRDRERESKTTHLHFTEGGLHFCFEQGQTQYDDDDDDSSQWF